jgi:hypothetical protein
MVRTRSQRWKNRALRLATSAFLLLATLSFASAQEPPLDVPRAGPLTKPTDALSAGDWVLYPAIHLFSLYSNNLYFSPTSPLNVWGFGVGPSMTAEWTNGIHSTTIYGNAERQVFPIDNDINTFDRQAGLIQKYSPLPDLIFKAQADYTHKTVSPGLQNAIPTPTFAPQTTILPNGNIVLPNGTIVSPSGQIVGQVTPGLSVGQVSIVNPYDLYTATVSVDKYLNRGIISLSSSFARQNYTNPTPTSPDSESKTFSGNGAFWLGPVLYIYANGTLANFSSVVTDTTSFLTTGGGGIRLNPMFGASGYYGRQGSQAEGSEPSGGQVYGGRFTYKPLPDWTFTAAVDVTVNIAAATAPSILALTVPAPSPLQIPLSTSVRISATTFSVEHPIALDWTVVGRFGYTLYNYIGSPRIDNVWLADALVTHEVFKNLSLAWEYQFTSIDSNAPNTSTWRHYVNMGATYKF